MADLLGGTRASQEHPSWPAGWALQGGEGQQWVKEECIFPLLRESCFTPLLFLYLFCIFKVLHSSCKHHLQINFP